MTRWQQPEKCDYCFPEGNFLNEKPIIETDPTSTVPSQQIYPQSEFCGTKKNFLSPLTEDSVTKYQKLLGNVFYGHFYRGKNHYQYFIDTQTYFAAVSDDVKNWLCKLKKIEEKKNLQVTDYPTINVIFSPSHNTNVGFSQYVNAYFFNGTAEIISINEDKEYTSNFNCEYMMLKDTIQRLLNDNLDYFNSSMNYESNYKPVRFIFVDDNIITGDSFRKANKLLQSLIPQEILLYYGTNIFEKCFVLIDRMSNYSRNSYIMPVENYFAFCEINVSSMRKYGDSCVCCKLRKQISSLYNRSSTKYASNYWNNKLETLKESSFEKIDQDFFNDKKRRSSYLRLMLSHIIKNFINNNFDSDSEIFKKIILLIDFYCNKVFTNSLEKDQYEYLNSFLPVLKFGYNELDESLFKKEVVESIIKIISRPFFTFNSNVKQGILRFSIILCETIICDNSDFKFDCNYYSKAIEVSKSIANLYDGSSVEMLDFLQNIVFDALTDLHSTYLLRLKTIQKVLLFTNTLNFDSLNATDVSKKFNDFYLNYSVCIQRLIAESSDETRSLRMEYMLISAEDTYCEKYNSNEIYGNSFYEKAMNQIGSKTLKSEISNAFKYFCDEVFLGNTRILYDGIEKFSDDEDLYKDISSLDATSISKTFLTDNYFFERWWKFRSLDYDWLNNGLKNSDINKQIKSEKDFYKLLCESISKPSSDDSSIIEYRYSRFLDYIKNMISQKYFLTDSEIQIALFTCFKLQKDNYCDIKLRDLEMIENTFNSGQKVYSEKKQISDSNAKFNIKKQLIDTIKDYNFQNLGYRIVNSAEQNKYNEQLNSNYIVINFQNIQYNDNDYKTLKSIIPVLLYLSISPNDKNIKVSILMQLIMRDILTYRNKIIHYLEEDFTNDVMQRYAVSVDTEAILKNEKVMSHTPMDQDKAEIKYLLDEKTIYSKHINDIKGWSIARNYCNTMIARLYNRVFRNINRPFKKIISEYEYMNRETYKLYISTDVIDGKNFPLLNIFQVVPKNPENNDIVFKLFNKIINFDTSNLKKFDAYKYTENGKQYAYNLDYVKSIIYRICFDAMRFSYGSGAESNDFVARIYNHYRVNDRIEFKKKYPDNKWISDNNPGTCNIKFYFEKSDSNNFDWLVIENELFKDFEDNLELIKAKLEDPLDFTDGHMSLITAKEYFAKMLTEEDAHLLLEMYSYKKNEGKNYFVTKLPIIAKRSNLNGSNMD